MTPSNQNLPVPVSLRPGATYPPTMRRLTIALLLVLAFPAAATAKGHRQSVAPPGISGVQQYVETVPTAHGGQPTSSVHGSSGGPGGGGGISSGGGGSGSFGSGSGSISPSTQRALASQGAAGRAAAALAAATGPAAAHHRVGTSGRGGHGSAGGNGGGGSNGGGDLSSSASSVSHATSTSPVSAVFKALTGSSSDGGMGVLLPIILIVCLLVFSTFAIKRRRRTTS